MSTVSNTLNASTINDVNQADLGSLANLDIETALMVVMAKRLDSLENQIKIKLATIEAGNVHSKALLDQLAALKAPAAGGNAAAGAAAVTAGTESATEASTGQKNLENEITASNNIQQMDLIALQSLTSKRGEAYEMLSNLLKKLADGRGRIVGNMS